MEQNLSTSKEKAPFYHMSASCFWKVKIIFFTISQLDSSMSCMIREFLAYHYGIPHLLLLWLILEQEVLSSKYRINFNCSNTYLSAKLYF